MDRMPSSPDVNQEHLEQLRAHMLNLFANDGALNPDELKHLIGPNLVSESERFEFRWFGEADAQRLHADARIFANIGQHCPLRHAESDIDALAVDRETLYIRTRYAVHSVLCPPL